MTLELGEFHPALTCIEPVGEDPDLVMEFMGEANPHLARPRCLKCGGLDGFDWYFPPAHEELRARLREHARGH